MEFAWLARRCDVRRIDALREAHEAAVRLDEALHRMRDWRRARGARWVEQVRADLRCEVERAEREEVMHRG